MNQENNMNISPTTQKPACDNESHYAYWSPCDGCKNGHPSFWKTIVESPQWEVWEKEVDRRLHTPTMEGAFDVDESRECGWFSPEHFQAFLKFVKGE